MRPMLSDRCLSCPAVSCAFLPVCDVGVLRPNGWMIQDETWHAGRPRPWPHCVRWRSSSPPKKGAEPPPIFGPCRLWPNCRPSQLLLSTCFVCEISPEPLNGFAPNSQGRHVWSLAGTSLNVKVKDEGHQGQRTEFSALSAACVRFMFGNSFPSSTFPPVIVPPYSTSPSFPSFNLCEGLESDESSQCENLGIQQIQ